MSISKQILYLILTTIFVLTCLLSLVIYTTMTVRIFPWVENNGTQFLPIITVAGPTMIIVGLAFWVLGRFMKVRKSTIALPFITSGILVALIYVDGSLSMVMQMIGSLTCVLAILVAIKLLKKDLPNFKN